MPLTLTANTAAEYRACHTLWMILGVPFVSPRLPATYHEGAALSRQNWRNVLTEKRLYSEEQLPAVEALLEDWQRKMERDRFVNSRQAS